jgi:RHS repeat-associated protein
MAYDAQGRRIKKKSGDKETRFCWDGERLLSDRTDASVREFVFYPGTFQPLAVIDTGGEILYFHNDHIGAPQEVTDSDGNIFWSAHYDALGGIDKVLANEFDNPLRLQGQYYDPEIDLCYNRFRYYNPHTASFISQDPLGLAAGSNVYAYAPNVWKWIDPLGLCKDCEGPSEPTTELYHGGELKGGEVQPKRFSTTTDPGHAAQYAEAHGGTVTEFEVPTRRLYELEGNGAEQLIDNLQGTTSTAKEWRFYGDSAAELNNYIK